MSPTAALKILMFSGDYWPNGGGIANHVTQISRALADQGVTAVVIGGFHGRLPADTETPRLAGDCSRVILVPRKGPRIIRGVVFLFRVLLWLFRLSFEKWDVVHFHNFVPDGLLLGVLNWPRAMVRVMTNHSSQYLKALARGQSMLPYRLLSRSIVGFVAPSEELAACTTPIMRPGQRVRYIANGVDTDVFAPGEPTAKAYSFLGVNNGSSIILAIRRHVPKCGLEYLVRAMPSVVAQHPEAVLCLVGKGEQTAALKSLTESLGMRKHILFPGAIDHASLPDVVRTAYVTVLPSLYEAVSLAGLESLACGVPVIGTRVGGIPTFVHDRKTGILVEPRSPEALAGAIDQLLRDPALRDQMAKAGRDLVVHQFTWDRAARQLLDYYRDLAAGVPADP
jgi:glycosyltransferase involved in cell wall biosynthesis